MKYLTKAEMEKINTKRLLAYKNKLLKVPSLPEWETYDPSNNLFVKDSPLWQELYANVKAVLATREHIERDK